MSGVPPIYLINLDRSTERLRRFGENNPHLKDVTRFPAIDGAALDRDALIASGHISADLTQGPGTVGCALSHIRLWEMAVAENRAITVFEDDAMTNRSFHARAEAVLADLADWDIVKWGWSLRPAFAWVDLGVAKVRIQGYGRRRLRSAEEIAKFLAEDQRPSAVRMLHVFGNHGYSISPKGAKAALEHCLPLRQRPIEFPEAGVRTPNTNLDVNLCGVFPSMNAFLCIPPLAIPEPFESDRESIDRAP